MPILPGRPDPMLAASDPTPAAPGSTVSTTMTPISMRVAYVAPEIPGLSSTFVYNEIFALERLGFSIVPISIHAGMAAPPTPALAALAQRTLRGYGHGFAAVARANLQMLRRHPRRYLATLGMALGDTLAEIRTLRVAAGIPYRFLIAAAVAARIEAEQVQHIHAHFAHFPGDIAMYASSLLRIPFSLTAHANDIFCNRWLLRQKCRRGKFVATISEFNRRYLGALGCDEHKVEIVRCGVDLDTPIPAPAMITDRPIVTRLGFVARLVEKKGVDTLLRACVHLHAAGTPFTLDIVGDGPELEATRALIAQLQLGEHVRLLGKLDNDAVVTWLDGIALFILPCRRDSSGDMDGIPVALMEAMLKGKPVISSRLSGIPELIVDGVTGLLIEPDDDLQLAAQIDRLILNPALAQRLASAARLHLAAEFDCRENARRLGLLFNRPPPATP